MLLLCTLLSVMTFRFESFQVKVEVAVLCTFIFDQILLAKLLGHCTCTRSSENRASWLAITLWFKMPNLIRKFVLMLYGFYIIFLHNTSLSKHQRFQEKWKRPTKVMKAKSKAREWIILDFHDFLAFLEQLGVVY